MGRVRVTFVYEPEDPDDGHEMGVSTEEYERTGDALREQFGAEEVEFVKDAEAEPVTAERQRKPGH